jgi:MFS family permease
VISLGLVSFFTDLSSEAIFPLLPVFLASLGASNAFLGALEGTADLVASVLKYLSGRAADRRERLKPLVLAGYGLSSLVRPMVAFAASPWHVLAVRVLDRVGKGIRTSPRDALLASAAPPELRGRAFGFHRAMDHAGAAMGTLLASGLLLLGLDMRSVFLAAAVPGAAAMVVLLLLREDVPEGAREAGPRTSPELSPAYPRTLTVLALFALANATDAFILVRAASLGAPAALVPLVWLLLHLVKASTATAGGFFSDRMGRKRALMLGWVVYAVSWALLGLVSSIPGLLAVTLMYGLSHGLYEGPEKALIADLSSGTKSGRAFGIYNMVIGVCALVSSTAFGAVLDRFGAEVAFPGFAGLALAAALALRFLVK